MVEKEHQSSSGVISSVETSIEEKISFIIERELDRLHVSAHKGQALTSDDLKRLETIVKIQNTRYRRSDSSSKEKDSDSKKKLSRTDVMDWVKAATKDNDDKLTS